MKIWYFSLLVTVGFAKSILQKSNIGQHITTVIAFFSNEITFEEFEKLWTSVENEKRRNETLCYYVPTKEENFFSCDFARIDIHYLYNASQHDGNYKEYLSLARGEIASRCQTWKDIRKEQKHKIILLTNFGNISADLIQRLDEASNENCELGELPIKGMLYSLLIFVVLATIVATIFHLWRKNEDRKIVYKLKFALAMAGNCGQEEILTVANLWEKMYIDNNFIEVKNTIKGKGSSSVVFDAFLHTKAPLTVVCPCLETQKFKHCPAVIKIVNNFGDDEFKNVLKEVTVASKLKWHKNVCCLLGWTIYLETYSLIFECMDGGDLLSWIKRFFNDTALVKEEQIAKILWQITAGMEYISAMGIVHKDLAARNILMTKNFEVKISDFGLASFCGIDSLYHSKPNQKLPIRWMAVESFCQVFSEASDIWSFGVIAWEMFTFGEVPYGNMTNQEIIKFVVDGNRLTLPPATGQPWQMLTHDCWKANPNDRPKFSAIKMLLREVVKNKTIDYGYYSCK